MNLVKKLFLVDWYPLFHANGRHCALLSVRLQFFPCALCVQVRVRVVGAIISLIASIYLRSIFWIRFLAYPHDSFISGAFYTSYYVRGVENGTVISTCSMGAGFWNSMPLDQWIPFSLVLMDLVVNRPRCGLDFLWSRHF